MTGGGDELLPRVRLATPEDAAAIEAIYAPIVRETAISFERRPPDVEEIAHRIRRTLDHLPWLVSSRARPPDDEDVLGYALASPYRTRHAYRWSAEVSVYIAESLRGRGVARSLYRPLHELLREQGYRITYAVITLPNPASVGLHESLAYREIGVFRRAGYKLGAWHDVLWMRREIGPIEVDPEEPIPLVSLDPATIDRALAARRS